MKRFVCVPESMSKSGIPEEAELLSKGSQLPIKISADHNDICIDSFPETLELDWVKKVDSGYIYWLDITDEYNYFSENTVVKFFFLEKEETHKPLIRESHMLKFRIRVYDKGDYKFNVIDADNVLHEGFFEVI
jgi:hypothetical protein